MVRIFVLLLSMFLISPAFGQTAESTPMTVTTVCKGDYCQQVSGALLKKLLSKGWKRKVISKGVEVINQNSGACGSSGLQRVGIPDYACFGIEGGASPYAPCSVLGLAGYQAVYFGAACEQHDSCYGTPGASKKMCDKGLSNLMKATCDETLSRRIQRLARETCHSVANLFESQLNKKGCPAYLSAQEQAGNSAAQCD